MKCHGLHGTPLCDLNEWGLHTKVLIYQQPLILEYGTKLIPGHNRFIW